MIVEYFPVNMVHLNFMLLRNIGDKESICCSLITLLSKLSIALIYDYSIPQNMGCSNWILRVSVEIHELMLFNIGS